MEPLETTFIQRLQNSKLLTQEQLDESIGAVGDSEGVLCRHLVGKGLLTRFQARQLRAGATGFYVDKYIVVDCLGRGGNSIVYKARHSLLPNRFVALKTLDVSNLHYSEENMARFRREIEIVTRFDHPNVVRAYDVLQTRTALYLVLECVEGGDLGQLVGKLGPLPVGEAVGYIVQAAYGLAYAHRCGIVHRDIKPANLLLTHDGVVKLTDLGLACFLSTETNSSDSTTKGMTIGTPDFMAPEQAEDAAVVSPRSDLYSLGTTLYHLLTGELPVKGASYLQKLQQLLTAPLRPLAEARPDVPPELAKIVDRMRARDPAARPTCAEEAISLLEPFARDTRKGDPRQWDGRHKAALVLEVLEGRATSEEACERHKLPPSEFAQWRKRFLEGATKALDSEGASDDGLQQTIRELYAKIGAQAMEIELLKKGIGAK